MVLQMERRQATPGRTALPSAEMRKNAGGQVRGELQAVDSKGEQAARMFLEP